MEARQMGTLTTTPDVVKKTSHKTLWIAVAIAIVVIVVGTYLMPDTPNFAAGFSLRQIVSIELILFLSGLMSGLSGFGFSAVGAACLLFIQPILEVPLLQTLSTGNQLLSVEQLRQDMPKSLKAFWVGPGPCIVGGVFGVPIGIWLLSHLPATQLMVVFGTLLVLYSVYSMLKPAGTKLHGFGGPVTGALVGLIGGAIGGFTAFPGAAVVVWTGLRDLPKAQNRAIVQPYIIMSQIYSLALIAWLHPNYISHRFWLLLAITLPAVLPGTFGGVAIYRRISDVNFKRVSFFLLGLSGVALLLKIYGPALVKLF
jgi:uncharacterized membrane protein YfcA